MRGDLQCPGRDPGLENDTCTVSEKLPIGLYRTIPVTLSAPFVGFPN
jgi:hypothetical protein